MNLTFLWVGIEKKIYIYSFLLFFVVVYFPFRHVL